MGSDNTKKHLWTHRDLCCVAVSVQARGGPACARRWRHRREDILLIAVCACLGGADHVAGIAAFGQVHRAWFEQWLELPYGISAHDTCNRVLRLLAPSRWNSCYRSGCRV